MDSIPPLLQRMIELAFFSGMTRHEIAIELGESPEAVEAGLRYGNIAAFQRVQIHGFSLGPATLTH